MTCIEEHNYHDLLIHSGRVGETTQLNTTGNGRQMKAMCFSDN